MKNLNNKIYIVTTGEYSDYSIHSVWSSKEKANTVCDIRSRTQYKSDRPQIEEYIIDGPVVEKAGFGVCIDLNGNKIEKKATSEYMNHNEGYPKEVYFENPVSYASQCGDLVFELDKYPNRYKKEKGKWKYSYWADGHGAKVEDRFKEIFVYAENITVERAYKAAFDTATQTLAILEGVL